MILRTCGSNCTWYTLWQRCTFFLFFITINVGISHTVLSVMIRLKELETWCVFTLTSPLLLSLQSCRRDHLITFTHIILSSLCASFLLHAHTGSISLSADIYCICFILYLCHPFLLFHPSCHLCHLFLGYPHSHLLPGARWDLVCQAVQVTQEHCRSVVGLWAWCQTTLPRHRATDRQIPSRSTSSNLYIQPKENINIDVCVSTLTHKVPSNSQVSFVFADVWAKEADNEQ